MESFELHIYESIRLSITAIEADITDHIYAFSFLIYNDEDDPRRPTLTFGYNTLERWMECTPNADLNVGRPVASNSAEAKWNYAFWLQNEVCIIGADETEEAVLRQEWIESRGLAYSDDDEEEDFDRCMQLGEQITEQFVALCVRVAKALHSKSVIKGKFGRLVPIIVHGLEYHDQVAEQTHRANPPGLASEFEDWVRGRGIRQ